MRIICVDVRVKMRKCENGMCRCENVRMICVKPIPKNFKTNPKTIMLHEQFVYQNVTNTMEQQGFETKNVANNLEIATSSSKMLSTSHQIGQNRTCNKNHERNKHKSPKPFRTFQISSNFGVNKKTDSLHMPFLVMPHTHTSMNFR